MRVTQLKNIYNDINYWRKGGFDMGFDVGLDEAFTCLISLA
jgi:hypothetical protein